MNKYSTSDKVETVLGCEAVEVTKASSQQRLVETLLYYLENGNLPWYCPRPFDVSRTIQRMVEKREQKFLVELRELLARPQVTERIMSVLRPQEVVVLLEALHQAEFLVVIKLMLEASSSILPFREARAVASQLLKGSLQVAASPLADCTTAYELIRSVKDTISPTKFQLCFKRALSHSQLSEGEKKELTQFVYATPPTQVERSMVEANIPSLLLDAMRSASTLCKPEKPHDPTLKIDDLYIGNSGLVLLNAGLICHVFKQRGWVTEKQFSSEHAHHKAIRWLQYLVDNKKHPYEYELALNKILCGMDPTEVMNSKVNLTREEKEGAHEFLKSIVAHWSAIKNTSIAGLRQSFLQRPGRLTLQDGAWHLHVESRAYDILLERMPWPISIMRLPWMTKPIYTQWQTQN